MSEKIFSLSRGCVEKVFNRFRDALAPSGDVDPIFADPIRPYESVSVDHLTALIEEAFWASLTPEEGRYYQFRLSLEPPNKSTNNYVFSEPKKFNVGEISDLAAVLAKGYKSIGVWLSKSGELEIWGIVEFPNWDIRIVANGPGQLLFSVLGRDGWNSFDVAITGSWWGFVDKGRVPISNAYFAGRHPGTILDLGLKTVFKGLTRASHYESIAKMMLQHQHGGALVIVPEDNDEWKKSLDIRYAGNIFEDVHQNVDEWHQHLQSKPDSKGWLFWGDNKTSLLREKLNRSLEFVAQLTAVDGATILRRDLAVYGFGAKLKPKDPEKRLKKVRQSRPFEDVLFEEIDISNWGVGTRHLSAAQFVFDYRDCVAIVCSQDGRLSALSWDMKNEGVQVVTHLEYAL
ncbi:MAG: putative sensor domain DACNV-containing protein [Blastocatellales bacterium]